MTLSKQAGRRFALTDACALSCWKPLSPSRACGSCSPGPAWASCTSAAVPNTGGRGTSLISSPRPEAATGCQVPSVRRSWGLRRRSGKPSPWFWSAFLSVAGRLSSALWRNSLPTRRCKGSPTVKRQAKRPSAIHQVTKRRARSCPGQCRRHHPTGAGHGPRPRRVPNGPGAPRRISPASPGTTMPPAKPQDLVPYTNLPSHFGKSTPVERESCSPFDFSSGATRPASRRTPGSPGRADALPPFGSPSPRTAPVHGDA